ncbi:MAG: hypothetical protein V1913_07605 [Fibrobacterota bacterium]
MKKGLFEDGRNFAVFFLSVIPAPAFARAGSSGNPPQDDGFRVKPGMTNKPQHTSASSVQELRGIRPIVI